MTTIRALIVHDHDGLRRATRAVFDGIGGSRSGGPQRRPEVDGCELIEVLEPERPEDAEKVVVLTGTPRSVRTRIGPHYPILSKPFNTRELLDAVSLRVPSLSGHSMVAA